MQSIDISNLNLKEIQYINGEQFENLLKNRFSKSGGNPILYYSDVLNQIETRIYNILPSEDFNLRIRKYMVATNLYAVKIPDTYKFRPDLVSMVFYETVEYFHVILKLNGMKSLLEFIPEEKNNLILVFKPEIIPYVI